jgi:hypothetical protein
LPTSLRWNGSRSRVTPSSRGSITDILTEREIFGRTMRRGITRGYSLRR